MAPLSDVSVLGTTTEYGRPAVFLGKDGRREGDREMGGGGERGGGREGGEIDTNIDWNRAKSARHFRIS